MLFIKDTTTGICMHTYKYHFSTAKEHNIKYTIFYKTIVSLLEYIYIYNIHVHECVCMRVAVKEEWVSCCRVGGNSFP